MGVCYLKCLICTVGCWGLKTLNDYPFGLTGTTVKLINDIMIPGLSVFSQDCGFFLTLCIYCRILT